MKQNNKLLNWHISTAKIETVHENKVILVGGRIHKIARFCSDYLNMTISNTKKGYSMNRVSQFIQQAPKAELHMHLEGTLEPEMIFMLAKRNTIKLPYQTVAELRSLYTFSNLQSFLDLFYMALKFLVKEEDFYDMTCAYINRAHKDNIRHVEIFFDPSIHVKRGVAMAVVIRGITRAFEYAETLGISCHLILSFMRDLPEIDAQELLSLALPFKAHIVAVGLASAEKDNPPRKFAAVFERARSEGFLAVCHAGEEGPADYIWQALDILHVSRIDHGNACVSDPRLVERLARERIPLTMCPLSNLRLQVIKSLKDHPAKKLLDCGVCVTINSDDPAYFGGYLNDNLIALTEALNLTIDDVYQLLKNGFEASFLPTAKKDRLIAELDALYQNSIHN